MATIYQELTIAPHLSVVDNVLLGAEYTKLGWLDRKVSEERVRKALVPLGLDHIDLSAPAGQFSVATQQLIEIARALVFHARIVILDEPTSSLTEADVLKLFQVVKDLRAQGIAVVYISHFLNEIHELADRITVLRDGHSVATMPMAGVTDEDIVRLMVGRPIEDLYPRNVHTPGEVILTAQNLKGVKLPKDASFELRKGEVFGIAGLNGSGRSELLRTVFGLDKTSSGETVVRGIASLGTPHMRWLQGIGFLSEDRKSEGLALNLSIAENIVLSNLKPGLISPSEQMEVGREWIEKLKIRCQGPDQAVGELSGGNQQKVAIARMLHHGAEVLLMDEPTRGIDVGSKEQIYRLIDAAALEGKAVIVISSYLPELLGVCDRIAVMNRGILHPAQEVAELNQEKLMHQAVSA